MCVCERDRAQEREIWSQGLLPRWCGQGCSGLLRLKEGQLIPLPSGDAQPVTSKRLPRNQPVSSLLRVSQLSLTPAILTLSCFLSFQLSRSWIDCELSSQSQPALLPAFTAPCLSSSSVPGPNLLPWFASCFDFVRNVSKCQPKARISPLSSTVLVVLLKVSSVQNSHCTLSLVSFRAVGSGTVQLSS